MVYVLTKELARRMEVSEIEGLKSRLSAIQSLPGNPMGIHIRQFGHATAFIAKGIPGPAFNTIRGLTSEDIQELDGILDYYKEHNTMVQLEIAPGSSSEDLLRTLANKGLCQKGFHSVLYGDSMDLTGEVDSSVTVRKLHADEFDLFADIYVRGFGLPSFIKQGIAQNNQVLYPLDSWSFYVAMVDGEPAGIGVLFIENGIATLSASATVPEFRRKGVHRALILERAKEARDRKVEYVVGQAKFASISSNNMERIGLRVAYTKGIWGDM
ncbi:GNAT family N-acetyltransferase [Ornithinibacillus sp. FSL M8-0202]|uniref:GNAT family N-acetyltransferase n=1 Tax=Ornithinibacillus sp. FSL M8-0202 TaxID=2921616 RepID=UPI0030D06880